MYNKIRSTIDACVKPVVLKKIGPFLVVLGPTAASRNGAVWRKLHACDQIDDREQVSEGGHFMELLVS